MKAYKGMSAHFVRSFLLSLDPDEPTFLRDAQAAGIETSGCSLQTAKKLSRELSATGYITRTKQGRSYVLNLTPEGQEFLTWAIETDYGSGRQPDLNLVVDPHAGVVLESRIPRGDWSDLMRQVKEFGLKTAFIPHTATSLTFTDENGDTVHVRTV